MRLPLPSHPRMWLLRWVLRLSRLWWLSGYYPDDFVQECHAFLLVWGGAEIPELDFKRAARRHFYVMAVAYGWKKPHRGSMMRPAQPFVTEQESAEGRLFAVVDGSLGFDPWPQIEANMEFAEIVAAVRTTVTTAAEWEMLKAFLDGQTDLDLAIATGQPVSQIVHQLNALFARIRAALGIELPGDRALIKLKRAHRDRWQAARTGRVEPVVVAEPDWGELSCQQLANRLGVSKATAHRIKKGGRYQPGHHNTKAARAKRQAGTRTELTDGQRMLSDRQLAAELGCGKNFANRAKREGWYIRYRPDDTNARPTPPGEADA